MHMQRKVTQVHFKMTCMVNIGITSGRLKNLVTQDAFILLGDGSIDFMEFLEVMAKKMGEHTFEDDLRDAFQLFDRDSNGFISKRELTFVMTSLGEQMSDAAVENMIKEVDLDGDGRVNYEGSVIND